MQSVVWYMMDHIETGSSRSGEVKPDMRYLTKPRGKGFSLRMPTPEILVGTLNPFTKKPFGKEIKLGLNTRCHAEAVRLREIRAGQIRQLEADALAAAGRKSAGRIADLTPESAAEWRQLRQEAENPDSIDIVLSNLLDDARESRDPQLRKQASQFSKIVFRGDMPIGDALEMYLQERRRGNPYGYDPLATTTAQNVRSSIRHLLAFLGKGATLHDVTAAKADQFRAEYLPVQAGVKPQTVAKHTTLLRGMWTWAITDKKLLRGKGGRPVQNPWTVGERGIPKRKSKLHDNDKTRTLYSAAEVSKLLAGFPSWGSRQGDLMRLLLATGCRVDKIGSLRLHYVDDDGAGFVVPKGKTVNARRRIPLLNDAQRLMEERVALANQLQLEVPSEERRLFPEWPLKPSTQKINSASQWFTRYRREVLGRETDGSLSLHSFRHTWRTMARRAGVPEDHIRELGGWEDSKDVSMVYDHDLTEQQLRDAQAAIWEAYQQAGYLRAY